VVDPLVQCIEPRTSARRLDAFGYAATCICLSGLLQFQTDYGQTATKSAADLVTALYSTKPPRSTRNCPSVIASGNGCVTLS
jgi:hypothetical protein